MDRNTMVLFEIAVKDIFKMLVEPENQNAQSISQAVSQEIVGGRPVQIQVTVQTDESEFIDDFTTIINRIYRGKTAVFIGMLLLMLFSCGKTQDECGPSRHELKTECLLVGPQSCYFDSLDSKYYYVYDALEVKTGNLFFEQELEKPNHNGERVEYCTCSELEK